MLSISRPVLHPPLPDSSWDSLKLTSEDLTSAEFQIEARGRHFAAEVTPSKGGGGTAAALATLLMWIC